MANKEEPERGFDILKWTDFSKMSEFAKNFGKSDREKVKLKKAFKFAQALFTERPDENTKVLSYLSTASKEKRVAATVYKRTANVKQEEINKIQADLLDDLNKVFHAIPDFIEAAEEYEKFLAEENRMGREGKTRLMRPNETQVIEEFDDDEIKPLLSRNAVKKVKGRINCPICRKEYKLTIDGKLSEYFKTHMKDLHPDEYYDIM